MTLMTMQNVRSLTTFPCRSDKRHSTDDVCWNLHLDCVSSSGGSTLGPGGTGPQMLPSPTIFSG